MPPSSASSREPATGGWWNRGSEGLKDTVLTYPQETVWVAGRFTAQRSLFLLDCHLLEHEDLGIMLNVLVE